MVQTLLLEQSQPLWDPQVLKAAGLCWSHRVAWVVEKARHRLVQNQARGNPEKGSAW